MARRSLRLRSDAPTRISVVLDHPTHQKLRALALVRSSTIQDITVALIEDATRGVRLPSVGDMKEPPAAGV